MERRVRLFHIRRERTAGKEGVPAVELVTLYYTFGPVVQWYLHTARRVLGDS